jgi:hypothetical protein
MPAPVNRNAAIPVLDKIEHLTVPSVGVQWPTVRKGYDWALSPVLVVNRRAIFHGDCAHSFLLNRISAKPTARFNSPGTPVLPSANHHAATVARLTAGTANSPGNFAIMGLQREVAGGIEVNGEMLALHSWWQKERIVFSPNCQ